MEGPVVALLDTEEPRLRASWQASVSRSLARLTQSLERPEFFDQACGLLVELVDLVERPASNVALDDARMKAILDHLQALQARDGFGATEMAFLLFSMKDILRETLEAASDGEPDARLAPTLNRVATLLHRLGIVQFETSLRTRVEQGFEQDLLATEYALLYERTRQIAITDRLTGLHNFGYFFDRLREEKARAERYQRLLSLIIVDIDHFKHYNDTHGHPAGNEVLKQISAILQEEAREVDIVARYGGEELVLLLPEATRRDATAMAERIRARVFATDFAHGENQPLGRISLSGGVATYPVDAWDETELVQRADQSLYQAKREGRNRVVAYLPPHATRLAYWPSRAVRSVALVGNFNNWNHEYDFMVPAADGAYEFVISLNRGVYQYKFVIDGTEWIPDPRCPERCPDTLGGENSVLRVEATP